MSVLFYLGIGCACTAAVCLFLKISEMMGIDGSFVIVFVLASILFAILAYTIHEKFNSYEMHKHTQIESEVQAE